MEYQVLCEVLGWSGINTDMLPTRLPPQDEPYFIMNGNNILIKDAKIKKIRGIDYLNDVTTQLGQSGYRNILGIPIYRKYSTGTNYLIAVAPRNVYYLQSDTTWTDISTGHNPPSGGNDAILSYANADDKFIYVISDDMVLKYWDGATHDNLSLTAEDVTTLKAKFLLEFKTHLILFNTNEDATQYRQRMWPSNPGLITTFSAEDKRDFDVEGEILNAKQLGNEIIIYFEKMIHKAWWVDVDIGYANEPLIDGIGIYAPKTLCGSEDVHYWLSQKGLMELKKGGLPKSVSKSRFDKLILDEIDPVYYYRAVAHYFPHLGQVRLCYPKSGSNYNDTQVIYDVNAGELISKKNLLEESYSAYGEFEKDLSSLSPDERKNYGISFIPILGDKDGYVYEQKINDYQDKSSNYESNFVIPPSFYKDRSRNKRLLQADLLFEKYTDNDITFVIDINNEMNEGNTFSYTITGNGNQGIRRYELKSDNNDNCLDILGKEFTAKIKDSDNPYGWDFHGAIFRGYYTSIK